MQRSARRTLGIVRYDEVAGGFRVQFHMPLRVELKDRVKAILGSRWVSARRSWFVPSHEARALLLALHGHAFEVDAQAQEHLQEAADPAFAYDADAWQELPVANAAPVSPILQEAAAYRARQTQLTLNPNAETAVNTSSAVAAAEASVTREVQARHTRVSMRDGQAQLHATQSSLTIGVRTASDAAYPSVYALMQRVDAALRGAFHAPQWVMGVVQGVTHSRQGHLYFRLVDVDPDIGADQAILNVAIFGAAAARVLQTLRDHQLTLDEGVTVALCGKIGSYAPRSSIQFVAHDIDVRVSRGEVELQRDRVVQALRTAGLSWKNARIEMPLLPERIALVTSAHGDALHDVIRTLVRAKVGAQLQLFDVPVQGPALEAAVLRALAQIEGNPQHFDLVLIIRGGGAANELAWWDNVAVGTAVADLSLPVVVGIGHERDETALHEVARFEATPTAAAQLVAQLWTQARDDVRDAQRALERMATGQIQAQSARLSRSAERFHARAGRQIAQAQLQVQNVLVHRLRDVSERALRAETTHHARCEAHLASSVPRVVSRAEAHWRAAHAAVGTEVALRKLGVAQVHLAQLEQRLARRARTQISGALREVRLADHMVRVSDPAHMLQRGYAIVRDVDGNTVRDAASLQIGASLHIELAHGRVRSEVQSVTPAATQETSSSESEPS